MLDLENGGAIICCSIVQAILTLAKLEPTRNKSSGEVQIKGTGGSGGHGTTSSHCIPATDRSLSDDS